LEAVGDMVPGELVAGEEEDGCECDAVEMLM
jgi:hypothetical protein